MTFGDLWDLENIEDKNTAELLQTVIVRDISSIWKAYSAMRNLKSKKMARLPGIEMLKNILYQTLFSFWKIENHPAPFKISLNQHIETYIIMHKNSSFLNVSFISTYLCVCMVIMSKSKFNNYSN